jgi:hypothetical protein
MHRHGLDLVGPKLYELLRAGIIESVRIDGCRRVPREAVEGFVRRLRSQEAA